MTRQLAALVVIALSSTQALAQQPGQVPPLPQPGQPQPLPMLPPPRPVKPPVVMKPMSIFEYARIVKPVPGRHEALLCHPYTGQPVRVCFNLPPGCVKVIVRKKLFCYEIDFDYGRYEVELNFSRRGRVRVDFND